ncbi:hypothetical protein VB715_18730 [Crocosphaera sp. UHCC 0190]|uniref:hypothetical protein n=1 Tax=Crocosphaera sp. UHCC 0190 TaxID=3110246 RepID=UPI002B21380C|nr:hypothetical protein [Crocosphaera sp. UHCC 0190]MEA5511811.1 hypothetical protein [Crocosphaera sp. UHCC 0190]
MVTDLITDPWHHSQSWTAYGHQWQFTYFKLTANYTIANGDRSLTLKIPITETHHHPSPQAWLDHWAKTKGKRQLQQFTQELKQPSLLDLKPESLNSPPVPTKTPKGISFGKTINQLYNGKCCTRRIWSERTAKTFINYFENEVKVPAYDKDLRYGGEIIGWLTLTQKPYQDELINMTQADLKAEGFPDYTFDQFINEFFDGKNQTVWVICFEFTPNEDQENSVTVEVVENPETQLTENQSLTETEELTDDEARDLLYLERKVERAFYEAGKALKEICDRRLYRNTHQTFEQYCSDRFAFKRRHPYQLMNAAEVFDNLLNSNLSSMCANGAQMEMRTNGAQTETQTNMSTIGAQSETDEMTTIGAQIETDEMCTIGAQILPTSERQVRPLTNLEPDQQREAWATAVAAAGGKVPSGNLVKSIVDQIRERTKVPNPWRVGEVATIIVKENPDLRGKGGCWAVITAVHQFSCTVRLWDGEYQVKPENLKELPYSNEQQEEVRKLCDRLTKIYDPQMEETAKAILSSLGKIDRPWLTEFEERLLKFLETDNF